MNGAGGGSSLDRGSMRLLICGSRAWTDGELILAELRKLAGVAVVIEGEAPGADTLARQAAEQLGIPVLPFHADWDRYGRGAGPRRNQQMLDEGHPDLVVAFSEDVGRIASDLYSRRSDLPQEARLPPSFGFNSSRGTADMVARARRVGVPVRLVSHAGEKSM